MENDIPQKIEILSVEADDPYRITNQLEIEFVLRHIIKSESRIALYYSDEPHAFILTRLLGVDASGLWLESPADEKRNRCVLESHKLDFVSSHAQVKVQFVTDRATSASYLGKPAIFLKLPQSIHRLQRREYFRLTTPVANPLHCVIPIEEAAERHIHDVTIMDISGGGVGLTCTEQDTVLIPGHTYRNCRINLLNGGEFTGTIEVKNLVVLSGQQGQTVRRAGCEFKNLDGKSVIQLQRYVTDMQRIKTGS